MLYIEHRHAIENPREVAAAINDFPGGQLDVTTMTTGVDRQLHRNRA